MPRPANSLRLKLGPRGDLLASISRSSGDFYMAPEVLELVSCIGAGTGAGNGSAENFAKHLRMRVTDRLQKLPDENEIRELVSELLAAGVLVDADKNVKRSLQQDGFGDPWVQWTMLADDVRTRAYLDVIGAHVKEDDVVVDVGSGSGVLTFWAARAGAKKVFAIEETDAARVLKVTAKEMGFAENRVQVFEGNSFDAKLPAHTTLVVSELFGNDPFEEGILQTLGDVASKLGDRVEQGKVKFIPGSVTCYFDLIDLKRAPQLARVDAFQSFGNEKKTGVGKGSGSSGVAKYYDELLQIYRNKAEFQSLSFPVPLRKGDFDRVGNSLKFMTVNLNPPSGFASGMPGQNEIRVQSRGGVVPAIPCGLFWFRTELAKGTTLSNHPLEKDFAEHWSPILLPFSRKIAAGDVLNVKTGLANTEDSVTIKVMRGKDVLARRG